MKPNTALRPGARKSNTRGLSLIELMVALLIASFMTLAIFAVMRTFESRKRTTTTVNDASQAGNYAFYMVDKWIRSAGSGLAQMGPLPIEDNTDRDAVAYGCRLLVRAGSTNILPSTSALPAPFALVNPTGTFGSLRLAPVLVVPSASGGVGFNNERSDVLLVMAGTAGNGEVPLRLTGPIAANTVPVNSAVTVGAGDLLLLADQRRPTAPQTVEDCMVQQVSSAGPPIGLGGSYAQNLIAGVSPTIYDEKSLAAKLGNTTTNRPNFLAVGVGDNRTLMSYDLLQLRAPALQAVAESVLELHAVYGIDNNGDGDVDLYVDPRDNSGDYAMSKLMDGGEAAATLLDNIKVVRVAMVLRTNLEEKAQDAIDQPFTPATLTLFSDVGLPRVRTLNAVERRFRYRVVESTVPIRNALLSPR